MTISVEREPKEILTHMFCELIDQMFMHSENAKKLQSELIFEHEETANARLEAEKLRDKYQPRHKFYWEKD